MSDTVQPESAGAPATKKKKKLGRRIERWALLHLVPPIVHRWMAWFDYTARKDRQKLLTMFNEDRMVSQMRERKGPVIICLWHNRLMFGPTAYQYCWGRGAAVMVSRSFDGEVIAAVLRRFQNFFTVRGGSSSKPGQDKGGQEALSEMADWGRRGSDLVITPDGPQGPAYKVKRGIIELARMTGLPIVPASANASRCLRAKSWDRTRFPFPYARFVYRVGDFIEVPPDADDELMERKRAELERTMVEITEFVDNFYARK